MGCHLGSRSIIFESAGVQGTKDGFIINAQYLSNILRAVFNNRIVRVLLLTYDQRLFVIGSSKVRSASITNVEGMRLYSISEMYATPPFRRFVFVSSEQEDSDSKSEVLAREISSVELTEDYVSKDAIAHLRKLFPQKLR